MIIIDKIKEPTPFFVRKPHPTVFKTDLEKQRYWAKQKKYWVEGYSEDVNGMLYFYAQEVMLKNRVTGQKYYPTVRDADVLISRELKSAMEEGVSPFIVKGRGVGLSSWGMNLPFYFFKIYPNSKCIATSRDKKTLASLFNEKTMIAYDEMTPDIKFDLINKNQTSAESYLNVGGNYLDEKGNTKYGISEFVCRDTQESDKATTNFSGAGAIFGFADEAPLMPRFNKFFDSSIEVFKDHSQNRIVGLLLSGGTVEDTVKPEALQRIQEVWANASAMKIRPIFIPATYGKFMTNGHSDHKMAEEELLKEREELKNLPDKLKAHIKNNPLNIDEIFEFAHGNNRFSETAIERISLRLKDLTQNPELSVNYKLGQLGGELIATPSKLGWLEVLEHPKPDIKYVLGFDGTQSTETTSDNKKASKASFYVMKGVDPQGKFEFAPVAKIFQRPKDFDDIWEKAILTVKYYNKFGNAKVTGERNGAGGVLAEKLLKDPDTKKCVLGKRVLTTSGSGFKTEPFFYRSDDVKDWQFLHANTYMKKYVENVGFKSLLLDCLKPDVENSDELDAFLACLYGWGTGDLLGEKPKEKKTKKVMIIVGWENGVPKWEERFV